MEGWDSVQTSHGWYLIFSTFSDGENLRRVCETQHLLIGVETNGILPTPAPQGRLVAEGGSSKPINVTIIWWEELWPRR